MVRRHRPFTRLVIGSLAMLFIATATPAAAQITVRWEILPSSQLSLHLPSPLPPGSSGPGTIVNGWNGATFDTLRNQLLILAAGGNGNYAGNEVYAFQHGLEQFTRLTNPSPMAQPTIPSADVLRDGSPPSAASYGGTAYSPDEDAAYRCGGSRWWDGNPTTLCWRFHPGTTTWENAGRVISGSPEHPGAYVFENTSSVPWMLWDPSVSKFLTFEHQHYGYVNFATMRSEPIACGGGANMSYGRNAVLDSLGRRLYVVGSGETRMLDLTAPPTTSVCPQGTADELLATVGATEIENLNVYSTDPAIEQYRIDSFGGLGLAWDPVAGVVVAYGRTVDQTAGRLYTLDPVTGIWAAWESDPAGPLPPIPTRTGMWSKVWLHDDCLYAVTNTSVPVYRTCSLPWRTNTPVPPPAFSVSVLAAGGGSGSVTGGGTYFLGARVVLSAVPKSGSTFTGWSGSSVCPTSGGTTFSMPGAPVTCTATFVTGSYALSLSTTGTGSGSVTGAGTYKAGATVTVSATPSSSSTFAGWSGNAACPAAGRTTLTMPGAALTCTATFNLKTFPLTLTKAGTGSGSVTGAGSYKAGATVTVSATPSSGSTFAGWSGNAACPAAGRTTLTMPGAALTCTATFNLTSTTFPLTLTRTGTGSGSVTGAGSYKAGVTVTVSATPSSGSTFAGWSGNAACPAAGRTTLTMPGAALTCTATFNLTSTTFPLTLTRTGTGSGSVTGAGSYKAGVTVTVSATPSSGSTFAGWSGSSACPAAGSTTLTMPSAALTCTATFNSTTSTTFPLTLAKTGTGAGSVAGAGTYASGATVSLSATPTAGSTFGGWSGSSVCPAAGKTSFTMPAASVACTATFNLVPPSCPAGTSCPTLLWETLPNSALKLRLPASLPPGSTGPGAIIGGWNSAAYDTTRNQLLVLAAGGHGDYAGNEVYAFQAATQQFALLRAPSTAVPMSPAPSVDVLSDGTPPSRHNYGGVGYDPDQDSAVICGGSRWYDGNPTPLCWRFHLASNAWENLGTPISGANQAGGQAVFYATSGTPFMVWDPQVHKFLVREGSTPYYSYLNFTTLRSEPIACAATFTGYGSSSAVIDPVARALYVVGFGQTRRLDLTLPQTNVYCPGGTQTNGTVDAQLTTTGATQIESLNVWTSDPNVEQYQMDPYGGIGLAWDPVANVVVAYGRTADNLGGRIYTLNPATLVWTTWEADSAGVLPPVPTGTGMWNKLWFQGQCLYAVTDSSLPVYRTCSLPWRTGASSPPSSFPVTLRTAGSGSGSVTGAGSYGAGATVTLSATPSAGSTFAGWSGSVVCPTSGAMTFSMPASAVACTATFNATAPSSFAVTLNTVGNGSGTVTGAGNYQAGATVTLSATPAAGSTFAGWTGDASCPGAGAMTFSMPSAAVTCVATFTLASSPPPSSFTISLATAGSGSGSIAGAGTYVSGTTVTLSAIPNPGSIFVGWSGNPACPVLGMMALSMPAASITCTATFVPNSPPPACTPGAFCPPTMTWTPSMRPMAPAQTAPLTNYTNSAGTVFGSDGKHMRMDYNSNTGQVILAGGDRQGVGDGNGQPSVWATSDGQNWTMLSPPCITDPTQMVPARPDNVIWAIDAKRNRGVIMPGFYFGIAKAQSECPGPTYVASALVLDLGTNQWEAPSWPLPSAPVPGMYGGDNNSTYGVIDPVSDTLYRYFWDGAWGANLQAVNLATNTWSNRQLGAQTSTQAADSALRNSFASRSQAALDVQGRALYFSTPGNRLFRVRLDIPDHRGEWVGQAPPACVLPEDSSQEQYLVFDSDHRAVLRMCTPNLAGEVVGVAAYFVDQGQWVWYPAPQDQPNPVIGNVFAYSPSCHCVISTGGHSITPSLETGRVLTTPIVNWTFKLQ